MYVPAGIPVNAKFPEASVVAVRTVPAASVSRIVTPESPGSPASRTPFPLRSLNFVPETPPACRLPKRFPVELGADSEIVTLIVPAPPGTVWTNPAGTVSRRV